MTRARSRCSDELVDRHGRSRGPVRLARSALVQVPSVIGAFAPVVILPINALTGLTTDQLRGLLAHELAHVRRHDYLVNAIQTIIETLLFYHPAVWWLSRPSSDRSEKTPAMIWRPRSAIARSLCAKPARRAWNNCDRRHHRRLAACGDVRRLLPRIRRILGVPDLHDRRRIASRISASVSVAVAIVVSLSVHQCAAHPAQNQQSAKAEPTTEAITPDDLVAKSSDYLVGRNDLA